MDPSYPGFQANQEGYGESPGGAPAFDYTHMALHEISQGQVDAMTTDQVQSVLRSHGMSDMGKADQLRARLQGAVAQAKAPQGPAVPGYTGPSQAPSAYPGNAPQAQYPGQTPAYPGGMQKPTSASGKPILPFQHYAHIPMTTRSANSQYLKSTGSIPGGANINFLDVHYNDIERLQLGNFPNLVKLNLESNQLQSLNGVNVCRQLQWVDASNNNLQTLMGLQGCTQMVHLNASTNYLTYAEVPPLAHLHVLKLRNNDIYKLEGLTALESLVELDLSDNKIKDDQDTNIMDLADLPFLKKLDLRKNKISKKTAREIVEHFKMAKPNCRVYIDGVGEGGTKGGNPKGGCCIIS